MVAAAKGGLKRQKFVERHSQRVDVRSLVDDAVSGQSLLGARVAEGADPVTGARQTEIAGKVGQTEIRDPECPVGIDQEVRGLDVSMKDAQAVGVVECSGCLGS